MDSNLQAQKQAVSLVAVVESAGVELRHQGNRHVGPCPFHAEDIPSFYVFDDGHFKCFGCGEHGDVIDFVQKLHSCDFKEALIILGIKQEKLTSQKRKEIKQLKRKRGLVKAFKRWERQAIDDVALLCRCCRTLLGKIRNIETLERYGSLYHLLQQSEYHFSILIEGNNEDRFELFRSRQI